MAVEPACDNLDRQFRILCIDPRGPHDFKGKGVYNSNIDDFQLYSGEWEKEQKIQEEGTNHASSVRFV